MLSPVSGVDRFVPPLGDDWASVFVKGTNTTAIIAAPISADLKLLRY
jgi:hypothetical protein